MRNIYCIGQTCVDVFAEVQDCPKAFQHQGGRLNAERIRLFLGGDATNVAIALTKLGYSAKLISGIGDDVTGDCMMLALERQGVDTSLIQRIHGQEKTATVIIQPYGGERTLFVDKHNYADFEPQLDFVHPGDIVVFSSLLQSPLLNGEMLAKLGKKAKQAGAILCADVYTNLGVANLDEYHDFFGFLDYFFPNQEEAMRYSGTKNTSEAINYFLGLGIQNVVMKLGSKGCMTGNSSGTRLFPPYPVDHVVDTTGAGDHFLAGFAAGVAEGQDLCGCVEYATASACICIQSLGASSSIMDKSKLLKTISDNKQLFFAEDCNACNNERNTGSRQR